MQHKELLLTTTLSGNSEGIVTRAFLQEEPIDSLVLALQQGVRTWPWLTGAVECQLATTHEVTPSVIAEGHSHELKRRVWHAKTLTVVDSRLLERVDSATCAMLSKKSRSAYKASICKSDSTI